MYLMEHSISVACFYAKNTCQVLNWGVFKKKHDSLILYISLSCLSGCGRLAASDLGRATLNITAISSDQSYFIWKLIFCVWYYYFQWCTPAVYDPFLQRGRSSVRYIALSRLIMFVVYNVCLEKQLCCQQKCCWAEKDSLKCPSFHYCHFIKYLTG